MRKTILLIVLLICAIRVDYGQNKTQPNKEATQKWLKEKFELYSPIVYNMTTQSDEKASREVKFVNCNMIIIDKGSTGNGSQTITIPLKEIYIPTYNENPNWVENMEIVFIISSREKLIKKQLVYANGQAVGDEFLNQISLKISKKIKDDKIPDRFNKAFKNLITICGGKLNDEVY